MYQEPFQIRFTLINDSSDCENTSVLILLSHKKDLGLETCILRIFLLFSIYLILKCPWAHSLRIPNKNITTSEYFLFESIKACSFVNMVLFFNRELHVFCFSKLKYRNSKTYFRLLLLLSADISLNLGPIHGSQQYNKWLVGCF